MFIKVIGGILVLASSIMIGIILSKKLESRLSDLKDLKLSLQILEKEISFLSNPLGDALLCASSINKNVSNIFKECSIILKSNKGYCVQDALTISINKYFDNTSLNESDKNILIRFTKCLGNYDIEHQVNGIKMVFEEVSQQERGAKEQLDKNAGIYKKLALMGGLAVVIVLV